MRNPLGSYWGSRLGLIAGLALVGVGTVGAGAWALVSTGPGLTSNGTVIASDPQPHRATPTRLVQAASHDFVFPGALNLTWPYTGYAAVEVEGMGLLGNDGSMSAQHAIASITKTMTAYVVLRDHPLSATGSGPTITLSTAMAAQYGYALKSGESAVLVKPGEQLTERQALEGMMLASAGDLADILANWDAGSVDSFLVKMNHEARTLGMTRTDYTDPTGLAASTVSTMADQLKLAEAVQRVPALASIVDEGEAWLPIVGEIGNINEDLGADGIDGIKTGTTGAAGACLLFSAHVRVGGQVLTILGIVLHMPGSSGTPWSALDGAARLVGSVEHAMRTAVVAQPGTAIAQMEQGRRVVGGMGVRTPLTVLGWPGLRYGVKVSGSVEQPTISVTRTDGSWTPVSAILVPIPPPPVKAPKPAGASASAPYATD